tara:strand:- start:35 stop:475 length:441 start_codon:yes stop_codon:yes gene_type:complete
MSNEKKYQLKEYAIIQAEHMRAQVGDNTWHYAMEVWLYPETHYWDYDEEGTVQLIERYITTNRDAWVKHWGEPSEVARHRMIDTETTDDLDSAVTIVKEQREVIEALLAEVKRLREDNKKLKDAINRCGFNDVEYSCLDILEGEEE